jgi:hypothetical protein
VTLRNVLFVVLVVLGPLVSPAAAQTRRKVSLDEAHELARSALDPVATKLPAFGFEDNPELLWQGFYMFQAIWDNPDGSVLIDNFAVDSNTGDVWNGVVCRECKRRSLRELQRTIRKRIGLTEKDYRKLRRHGPMC